METQPYVFSQNTKIKQIWLKLKGKSYTTCKSSTEKFYWTMLCSKLHNALNGLLLAKWNTSQTFFTRVYLLKYNVCKVKTFNTQKEPKIQTFSYEMYVDVVKFVNTINTLYLVRKRENFNIWLLTIKQSRFQIRSLFKALAEGHCNRYESI